MLPSHLRVFISSVMADAYLAEERGIVREAIESLELTTPWTFESSSARPAPPGGVTLQAVGESDMLVLIVANRHTPPVQAELDEARRLEKPILAFVERLGDTEASAERREVVKWLSERVTYKEFEGRENLEQEVLRAIRTELIEGYRKRYEGRLTEADIPKLVALEPYPGLIVRTAEKEDVEGVENALMELKQWYPDIEEWIAPRVSEIGSDKGKDIRVAEVAGDIGAVAILRDKVGGVRKFATLYVRPTAQGGAIGPHLVREEVVRAAKAGVRKAYVTCAGEITDRLMPILEQSGFVPEGVSRGRYREGSAEWVLGKTFVHDHIAQSDFVEFVKNRIIIEAGGEILIDRGDIFKARIPRYSLTGSEGNTVWYAISMIPDPENDYARHRAELGDRPWKMVSIAGRPADTSHPLHEAENWIDGADIYRMFYPVTLETPDTRSIVVTILPQWADAIIPFSRTPSLFVPTRLQIRTDNVYYRTPDRYGALRRGSRLFFYVSDPEQSIRGSAIITSVFVGSPESCFELYGSKGIYSYSELEEIAKKHGQVLAISFDWYEEFESPVTLSQLRNFIPTYNPQSASVLQADQAQHLLRMASRGGI